MRRRWLMSLLTPLLMLALSGGSCFDEHSPTDSADGDPFCEQPVYDPAARTVRVLVDEVFSYDVYPSILDDASYVADALTIVAGSLPPGVELDFEAPEWLGTVVGIPTETGSWEALIEASVECEGGEVLTAQLSLIIEVLDACLPIEAPASLAISAEPGESIAEALVATGGIGTLDYSVTGDLPAGLEFDGEVYEDPFVGFEGAATESGSWQVTVTVTDECPEQQSVVIPVTITIAGPTATVPPGLYGCSLLGLEALWCERFVDFGSLHPPYCVGAGTNGWAVLSLADPFFGTLASDDFAADWGAIPLAGGPAGQGYTVRAMFVYGPYGVALATWDNGWGLTALWGFDAVSDACGLDDSAGAADRSGLSYCLPGSKRVWGVTYYEANNFFTNQGFIDGTHLQGGTPRSSCPLAAGQGKVFILTDAEGGEDGKLFCGDFENSYVDCDYIGDIGSQPVCVRKEGNIWAASDFTDDTVTCGLVNSGPDAVITITVAVGDGPYRLDLIDLGNGNTAIGCAGFNDNSFSVIVVDALAQLVSNRTQALPAGISAPGGVAFLPDGSFNLIVSGNATDNVAVVDTGLGP